MLKRLTEFIAGNAPKLALVVRADLKMGKGKTSAQCAHAAVLCYQHAITSPNKCDQETLENWLHYGQTKIVLRVNGIDELMALQKSCQSAGILSALVCDAGRTQVESGTATVLGVGPAPADKINELTQHLKLL